MEIKIAVTEMLSVLVEAGLNEIESKAVILDLLVESGKKDPDQIIIRAQTIAIQKIFTKSGLDDVDAKSIVFDLIHEAEGTREKEEPEPPAPPPAPPAKRRLSLNAPKKAVSSTPPVEEETVRLTKPKKINFGAFGGDAEPLR